MEFFDPFIGRFCRLFTIYQLRPRRTNRYVASMRRHVFLVVLTLAAASCGGGGMPASLPPDTVTAEQACSALALSQCQKYAQCSSVVFRATFAAMDDCVQWFKSACPRLFLPGSSSSPAQVNDCAQTIPAAACDLWNQGQAFCGVHPGSLADGSPCQDDPQCQSGRCSRPDANSCGQCRPALAKGQPCTDTDGCGGDLTCYLSGPNQQSCMQVVGEGKPCGGFDRCAFTLFCNATGVCERTHGAGQPCTADVQCDIDQGLVCGAGPNCQAATLSPVGDPCDVLVGSTVPLCTGGTSCSGAHTCVATVPAGGACDGAKDLYCGFNLACVGGTCRSLTPPATLTCN